MTVLDASMKLYEWFSVNDSFHISKNSGELLGKKHAEDEEKAAIECSLAEFSEMGIVSASKLENPKIWVLKRDFKSLEQTIKLTPETCLSIAQIVNGLCKVIGNETELADPKSITDKEIKTLIGVCATLMEMQSKNKN
jgi:hypothetical protein